MWSPPLNASTQNVLYQIRYRLKSVFFWLFSTIAIRRHDHFDKLHTINNLEKTDYEITGLKSFSIYEISISAQTKHGRSSSVRLIQITGGKTFIIE